MSGPSTCRLRGAARVVAAAVLALLVTELLTGHNAVHAQENPLEPLDASSPQATYLSFVEQVDVLEELLRTYERDRTEANQAAFTSALQRTGALFDFSQVAEANQAEVVGGSFARLADILNRIPPPNVDEIPDADDVEAAGEGEELTLPGAEVPIQLSGGGITNYTLPGTEITITRVDEGPQIGDYVFSADTVTQLAEWRDDVDHLPVKEGVEVRDWVREEADFTGHLVPRPLVDAIPNTLDRDLLGSPSWKLVVDAVILGLVAVICVLWHQLVGRRGTRGAPSG